MWTLENINKHQNENLGEFNGKWVPARPINYKHRTFKEKFAEAMAVFTGKADCFIWPEGQ